MKEIHRNDKGFSLIELLTAIVLLGILASLAIPVFINQKAKAESVSVQMEVSNLSWSLILGIATGSLSGYAGAPGYLSGTAPLTGILSSTVSRMPIGSTASVYYDSTASPSTWCVSDAVNGTIWLESSAHTTPLKSTTACTSATSIAS